MPNKSKSPKHKARRTSAHERETVAYVQAWSEGRREAEEKARNEIICRTPQELEMRSEEGRAWLEAPEQTIALRAHNIALFYFDLACVLMKAKGSTPSYRAWAERQILLNLRAGALPPEDNHRNRRAIFLMLFVHMMHNHRVVMDANAADYSAYLPTNPRLAEQRRQEIEENRAETRRTLAPRLAHQLEQQFLSFYPDERGKLDLEKLAEAIARHAKEEGKRRGIKKEGSKYKTLADATRGTSFHTKETTWKEALKTAEKKERARRGAERKAREENQNEPWEEASFPKKRAREG